MQENIKRVIDKLLTTDEQYYSDKLIEDPLFQEHLEKIWDATPESNLDALKEKDLIWSKICKKTHPAVNRRLQLFSYAASVLILIMGLGIAFLLNKEGSPQIMNIYKVGHQTTDIAILPDGTKVILGAESRISYPSSFDEETRVVELSGQAFFYVEKSDNQPFIVKTDKIDISVLGTEFEVFSYDSDDVAEVTLLSGKVRMTQKNGAGDNYTLSPNERVMVSADQQIKIDTIDADKYTMWRDKGTISFSNERLEHIIPRLEKWFGRKIKCDKKTAHNYRFTFTLHDETLKEILNVLAYSSKLSYKEEENGDIIISPKSN